jgi:hypothetical protein
MNAATLRYMTTVTMAYLLVSLDGSHFQISQDVAPLLVGQLETTLDGLPTNSRGRIHHDERSNKVLWFDSSSESEDYLIHRSVVSVTGNIRAYMYGKTCKKCTKCKEMRRNRPKQNKGTGVSDKDKVKRGSQH